MIKKIIIKLKWIFYEIFGWPKPQILWKIAGWETLILDPEREVTVRIIKDNE